MEPCVSSYVPKISMMLMLTVVSRLTILPSSKFFVGKLDLNWRADWLVNEEQYLEHADTLIERPAEEIAELEHGSQPHWDP